MKIISPAELLDTVSAPEFVLNPLLPKGGAAVIGGAPGEGKSWLQLDLAICLASQIPWLGRFDTSPSRVLMVDEENALPLVKTRLEKLSRARSLNVSALPVHFAVGQGLNLSDTKGVEALRRAISEYEISVVMLDSFIRIHRGNENAANEIAQVLSELKQFMNQGVSFVFTHHTRKPGPYPSDNANSLRGSSDIRAFVDTQLAVRRSEGSIIISQEKARWTEPIQPVSARLSDTVDGGVLLTCLGNAPIHMNSADAFILKTLENGIVARKNLIELAKGETIAQRTLDGRLKTLVSTGKVRKSKMGNHEIAYEIVTSDNGQPPSQLL